MIYIKIDNDVFYDDAVVLVRSFYPRTEVMALKADSKPEEKDEILSIEVPDVTGLDKKNAHEVFKDSLYKKLSEKTGKKLPWGYLTGVRPSKIAYTMLEEGATKEQIKKHFMDKHYASEDKAELALTVARKELDILTDMDYKTGYSLYIGIPFCPSICLYCSFSSYALGAYKDYVDNYVDALIKEIRFVAESMKGRRLDTVYMGGGTPTTLSAAQLDKVLTVVEEAFDLSRCRELTVEAGRPDSITREKLEVLRKWGISRISINPQTMSDKVLEAVGRRHTARQTVEAYEQAVKAGFDDINMDLIAGLPADDAAGFADSIRQVLDLNPSNITVHTLALKKGAALFGSRMELPPQEAVAAMLAGAEDALRQSGYEPYYLYRQKYMSGSFENTGWCRPGYTGLYNIYMMEELHTILSLGGGGMNKINLPEEKLARYRNPKIPQDYISRIDTILQQKDEIFSILRGLREQNP